MAKRKNNIDDIDIVDDFELEDIDDFDPFDVCLLYTSPSPRDS